MTRFSIITGKKPPPTIDALGIQSIKHTPTKNTANKKAGATVISTETPSNSNSNSTKTSKTAPSAIDSSNITSQVSSIGTPSNDDEQAKITQRMLNMEKKLQETVSQLEKTKAEYEEKETKRQNEHMEKMHLLTETMNARCKSMEDQITQNNAALIERIDHNMAVVQHRITTNQQANEAWLEGKISQLFNQMMTSMGQIQGETRSYLDEKFGRFEEYNKKLEETREKTKRVNAETQRC